MRVETAYKTKFLSIHKSFILPNVIRHTHLPGIFCKLFCIFIDILFLLLQYVTEKMGGAEGTKLDLDFVEMERVSISTTIPLT